MHLCSLHSLTLSLSLSSLFLSLVHSLTHTFLFHILTILLPSLRRSGFKCVWLRPPTITNMSNKHIECNSMNDNVNHKTEEYGINLHSNRRRVVSEMAPVKDHAASLCIVWKHKRSELLCRNIVLTYHEFSYTDRSVVVYFWSFYFVCIIVCDYYRCSYSSQYIFYTCKYLLPRFKAKSEVEAKPSAYIQYSI